MKTIAVIQARMGSSRLPNKAMLHLNGYPIIEWVASRAKKAKLLNGVIVAIPNTKQNDVLEWFLKSKGFEVYRGDETDVLGRMVEAARTLDATHFVRICADNPFVCWNAIDDLVEFFMKESADYAYNHIPRNNLYPDGIGAEMTSMETLENIHKVAILPTQREHCFNYIWENQTLFNIKTFDPLIPELRKPNLKLDIDTMEDYLYINKINAEIAEKSEDIITQKC
jgi:spore coat polysaccharide biosynthesis protein SpsF